MNLSMLEAMLAESALDADLAGHLAQDLGGLDALAAPAPSAELAALFEAPVPVESVAVPRAVRARRTLAGALVLAVSSVGATGLSAAANTLPPVWQRHVASFSHRLLPFHFSSPRPASGVAPDPRVAQPVVPGSSEPTPPDALSGLPSRRSESPKVVRARVQHAAVVPVRHAAEAPTPGPGPRSGPKAAPVHHGSSDTQGHVDGGSEGSSGPEAQHPSPGTPTGEGRSSDDGDADGPRTTRPPEEQGQGSHGESGTSVTAPAADSSRGGSQGSSQGGQSKGRATGQEKDQGQSNGQSNGQGNKHDAPPQTAPTPGPVSQVVSAVATGVSGAAQ